MKITRRKFLPFLSIFFLPVEVIAAFWRNIKAGVLSRQEPPIASVIDSESLKGYQDVRCLVRDTYILQDSADFHTYTMLVNALPLPLGCQSGKVVTFQLSIEDRGVCAGDEIVVWFLHRDGASHDDFEPVVENLTAGKRLYPILPGNYWQDFMRNRVVALYRCPCGKTWWDYVLKSEMTADEREADDAWWAEAFRRTDELAALPWPWPDETPRYEELEHPAPKRERLCNRCRAEFSVELARDRSGPDHSGRTYPGNPPRRTPMGKPLPLNTKIELE